LLSGRVLNKHQSPILTKFLGKRIRKNTFQENNLQDSDDEHNALEEGNSSDETECDSYDLQVLSSLHQANFKDFGERISAQTEAEVSGVFSC
jgi:hypothetical protein